MDKRNILELKSKAAHAAAVLKSLSNVYRLLIMCELSQGERSVSDIQGVVDLSQSALSQHLARLRRDGLVSHRRSARMVYYSIASREALAIMATLYEIYCSQDTAEPEAATALATV